MLDGEYCGSKGDGPFDQVGAENPQTTSCAFALNVHDMFLLSGSRLGQAFEAFSPVTNRSYTVVCEGRQPTLCKNDTNATVLLFRGSATFHRS